MKRAFRILLEVFGPPAIGSIAMFVYVACQSDDITSIGALLELAGLYLVFGTLVHAFYGLIYMTIIEVAIRRGLPPSSWRLVGLSSLLGLLVGVKIAAPYFQISVAPMSPGFLILDGLGTGFVMGLLLKRMAYWGLKPLPIPSGPTANP
jgi:hypothetical protein